MKYSPAGTLMGVGKLHPPPGSHGAMNGSFCCLPLRTTCPSLTATRSPGPATTRLMKLTESLIGTASGHTCERSCGTPQRADSAPLGGWNTTTSPTEGLENE